MHGIHIVFVCFLVYPVFFLSPRICHSKSLEIHQKKNHTSIAIKFSHCTLWQQTSPILATFASNYLCSKVPLIKAQCSSAQVLKMLTTKKFQDHAILHSPDHKLTKVRRKTQYAFTVPELQTKDPVCPGK